jgi:hypothetical protein
MNKQIDLSMFSKSKFRMKFKLDQKDLDLISNKGRDIIESHAYSIISNRLAPVSPERDGKQTPFKGHPVFKAQHATATCCRGCLQKWHKIKRGKQLSEEEISYVVSFIMSWIDNQAGEIIKTIKDSEPSQLSLF